MEIEHVTTAARFEEFLGLPFRIHKKNSLWVPPLLKDDRQLLSPGKHPFWESAERELFLCLENGRTVGRIAAIIDHKANEYRHEKCGAFGFLDFEKNQECLDRLLDAVWQWHKSKGMNFIRGPLNPSTNYTCGTLVAGFQFPPALMMTWNPPWYPEMMEKWGLFKEADLLAYTISRKSLAIPDWIRSELAAIKAEARFTARRSSKKTMRADVAAMLEIYRDSWAANWGFSPLSKAEAELFVKELGAILDLDFFILFFQGKKPVAGMVALPDLTPLLKKLRGKIGFSSPWHWWTSRKEIKKGYRIILFGILPQYRMHGLPMLLLDEMLAIAAAHPDLEWIEGSWVLEDNAAIDELIEDFGGKITKRYRIYRKEIPPC